MLLSFKSSEDEIASSYRGNSYILYQEHLWITCVTQELHLESTHFWLAMSIGKEWLTQTVLAALPESSKLVAIGIFNDLAEDIFNLPFTAHGSRQEPQTNLLPCRSVGGHIITDPHLFENHKQKLDTLWKQHIQRVDSNHVSMRNKFN